MEELITKLNELYDSDIKTVTEPGDPYLYFDDKDPRYDEVVSLCCEHLITHGGGCNWSNIEILRKNGFRVFPGDRDSFGWLVGCIQKNGSNKATVCYG